MHSEEQTLRLRCFVLLFSRAAPAILYKEGQTEITVDDMEQEVYFKWVTNNSGETRLLMVYSAIKIVKGIWLFSFICWMVMILIFVLLIRLHSRSYQDRIDEYRKMTFNLRD